MKGRVIALLDRPAHAALVVDGRLEDLLLHADHTTPVPRPGEIWAARVQRIVQGAAFVDLGHGHSGYLRGSKDLKGRTNLFPVQIASVAEPGKATPVDGRILIKGRGLILSPNAPGINISRRIKTPEERDRLTAVFADLPEDTGLIVRSAAEELDDDTLRREFEALSARAAHLEALSTRGPLDADHSAPRAIALREWTSPDPDMIAAGDNLAARLSAPDALAQFGEDRDLQDRLTPGDGDPFDHFGVWDEIERLKSPRADLPSGGWMAIEATRAMVTVDVNTGERFGQGDAMTTNIEAVRELPRQLRLRGLGGQVILDFAPMKKMHRRKIEEELKRAFRHDPIDTTLAGWTPLGNFELTRKRERIPLGTLLPD